MLCWPPIRAERTRPPPYRVRFLFVVVFAGGAFEHLLTDIVCARRVSAKLAAWPPNVLRVTTTDVRRSCFAVAAIVVVYLKRGASLALEASTAIPRE